MTYFKYDGTAAVDTAAPANSFYGTSGSPQAFVGTSAAEGFWGAGPDTMTGGAGDDTYYLQAAGDKVVEYAGGGVDKIVAWQSVDLANYQNIENLEVDGDKTYGAGDTNDNIIMGGAGSQQLYGGGGQDVLVGGAGADTFIIVKGAGNDVIQDFNASEGDVVRLTAGYTSFAQVQQHLTQVGADVKLDLGGTDGLIFRNLTVGQLTASNFALQLDTSKLGTMTFHDDFNGPLSLWDATNAPAGTWRPDFGYQGVNGVGSYTEVSNSEQEIYTSPFYRGAPGNSPLNPFTSNADGTLTITAAPSSDPNIFGYHYTSGMISTAPSFAQTYGYFEMRAELPSTAGAWPAFWLIPADGSWPPELDVMETLTKDARADYTTWHSGSGGVNTSNGIASFIPDTTSGFHTYGVLWTKTDLVWYVDGVEVFHQATPTDMNKPMFMIANLALGGWGGAIDDTHMPAQMKIDYVHAYALADGSSVTVDSPTAGLAATSPIAAAPPPPVSPPPPPSGQVFTASGNNVAVAGTAGNDTISTVYSHDTLTGGAGADTFLFPTRPTSLSQITDFQLSQDKLDISGILKNYHGTDPIADRYVSVASDGHGGTYVLVDPDGPSGSAKATYVADLTHVSPTGLTSAQLFGGLPAAASPPPPPVSPPPPPPPPPPTGGVVLTSTTNFPGSTLVGGAGDDTLNAGQGSDTMTGGAGGDTFAWATNPWSPGTITDFQVGVDKLDVSKVYTTGYHGTDPLADHYAMFVSDSHGGTAVLVDPDGPTGAAAFNYVADLAGVSPTGLTSAQVFGGATTATSSAAATSATAAATPGQVLNSTTNFPGSVLVGGAGADTFNAGQGSDTMTGGAGADHFVFAKTPWAPAEITDFQHGQDVIDLIGVFAGSGYAGSDPVADHKLTLLSDGAGGTKVLVGSTYFLHVDHVDPSVFTGADWITH